MIRIDDFDLTGKVLPGSGKVYAGANALEIVQQLNSHPFTADLAELEFMRNYLNRIGEQAFSLPDAPEEAARAFLQHLVNRDCANFELGEGDVVIRDIPDDGEGDEKGKI